MQLSTREEMTLLWKDELYPLSFRLGVTEKVIRIPALVLFTPWTRLPLKPVCPPWEQVPASVSVVMVPAQPAEERLPALSLASESFRYVLSHENRYVLSFAGSFEQYLAKFGAKQRHNLRRQARRFAEFCGGRLHNVEYCTIEELSKFRHLAMEISRKSPLHYKGAGLPEGEGGWRTLLESV